MPNDIASIAARLQAARLAQGLSQRALSELTGLPQAQISRIEAGAVDLRLSSLLALGHALQLELTIIPQKALPAIRALGRDVSAAPDVVAIRKDIQRIANNLRLLQIATPDAPDVQALQRAFTDLQQFAPARLDAKAVRALRQRIARLDRAADRAVRADQAIAMMCDIGRKAADDTPRASAEAPSRPAYSLDEEDDDA